MTTEATTTNTGIKTFTCTVCGETREETIAKLSEVPETAALEVLLNDDPTTEFVLDAGTKVTLTARRTPADSVDL